MTSSRLNRYGRSVQLGAVMILLVFAVGRADAAISFDLAPVDNSAVLTGYVTYDLRVTTDTDWTAAAGLLELTAGSVYQHEFGGDTGPSHPLLLETYPDLEFDTYVIGNIAGGGGDVGGTGYAFNDGRLDVSWYNLVPDEIGTTTIGRLTLTDDTAGNLSIMLTNQGKDTAEFDVAFSPGVLPGVLPVMSQIVEETQDTPATGVAQELWLPSDIYSFDWTDYFVSPRLAAPQWDYGDPIPDRSRYLDMDDRRHAGLNTKVLWEPRPVEPTQDDLPSTLPEPGALLLMTAGLGTVMLRRRVQPVDA